MASENGATATEPPLPPPTASLPPVSALRRTLSPDPVAGESNRKRSREETPTSPTSTSISAAHFNREYSPIKVARLGLSAQLSPPLQLTGAAALEERRLRKEEEERRNPPGVSENPNHRALNDLMSGGTLAVSRPQDAPASMDEIAIAAEATAKALGPVTIPQPNVSDARTDISPHSATSGAAAAADSHPVINSPGPMDIDHRDERQNYVSQPEAQMGEKTTSSLSYPGLLNHNDAMPAPAAPRHSSLPHNGEHVPASSKKHKCPYCETEFTRHHNLKSHLLTHSQEKPYCCQTCNLRFRRLHDLKRHGKLHTGEKPHVCPKCDRKFARGDALARHSKGAGGCAGRRASMGSFDDQGDYDGALRQDGDDSGMMGVVYDGNGDVDMSEEERRRLSLPAIKAHQTPGDPESTGPQSRTYPPAVGQRTGPPNVLYPPNVERSNNAAPATSNLANSIAGGHPPNPFPSSPFPSHQELLLSASRDGSSSLYIQGITESPKPLSPAVHDQARPRSPNLAGQYQHQQQYPRRPSEREIHSLPTLPPPHGQPAPPAIAPTASMHSRTPSGPASHNNSGDSASNIFAQGDHGMWTYIQQLEDRLKDLGEHVVSMESNSNAMEARLVSVESTLNTREAKITSLEMEISGLRKELADSRQQQQQQQQQHHEGQAPSAQRSPHATQIV